MALLGGSCPARLSIRARSFLLFPHPLVSFRLDLLDPYISHLPVCTFSCLLRSSLTASLPWPDPLPPNPPLTHWALPRSFLSLLPRQTSVTKGRKEGRDEVPPTYFGQSTKKPCSTTYPSPAWPRSSGLCCISSLSLATTLSDFHLVRQIDEIALPSPLTPLFPAQNGGSARTCMPWPLKHISPFPRSKQKPTRGCRCSHAYRVQGTQNTQHLAQSTE